MIAVRTQNAAGGPAPDRNRLRPVIEHAVPLSAGHDNSNITATAGRARRAAAPGSQAGFDPAPYTANWTRSWGRSARATTSSRSAWTRRTPCGCSCTPAPAASATRSRSSTSARPERDGQRSSPAGPGSGLPRGGHAAVRPLHRGARWAQRYALLNRAEMMDRVVPVRVLARPRPGGRTDQLPPQLHRKERHYGKRVWVTRKGAIRARRRPRADPRLHGHRVLHRRGPGEPRVAEPRRTARDGSSRRNAARKTFTLASAGRHEASSTAPPTPSWTRSRRPTSRSTR